MVKNYITQKIWKTCIVNKHYKNKINNQLIIESHYGRSAK